MSKKKKSTEVIVAQCEGWLGGEASVCTKRSSCWRYTSIKTMPSTPWLPVFAYMCLTAGEYFQPIEEVEPAHAEEGSEDTEEYQVAEALAWDREERLLEGDYFASVL